MKFSITKVFLLATAVLFIFASPAICMQWRNANQATVAWDPVDTTAFNPGDVVEYTVYTKDQKTDVEVLVGGTADTNYTVTFGNEGKYIVGVQANRLVDLDEDGTYDPAKDVDADGNPIVLRSDITWSDSSNPTEVPDPFGLMYYARPAKPVKVRPAK